MFHAEIHSNMRSTTKWRETKTTSEQSKKTTNQSETIALAAVYTHHIRSGVFKDFQSEPRKTPLTPDKECKWIPTCGEEELKRPSLIIANMRWWLHTRTHTQERLRLCADLTKATNKSKWQTHTAPQRFKIWTTQAKQYCLLSKVQITNTSKLNSTLQLVRCIWQLCSTNSDVTPSSSLVV